MDSSPFFAVQFVWFLLAWGALAGFLVWPRLRGLDVHDALAVSAAPQLFRVLGVGLVVEKISPGMPSDFAVSTAVGDGVTAFPALLSLVALRNRWGFAIPLVWVFSLFGAADLVAAAAHGVSVGAAQHLAGQWYVPTLGVPLMVVSHLVVFRILLWHRRGAWQVTQ